MAKRAPKVDHEKCIGCAVCYSVCPASPNVYEIKDGKSWVVHPEACTECESCIQSCPVQAITLVDISEAGPKPS